MSRNLERRIWPVAQIALVILAASALLASCDRKSAVGGDPVLAKVDGTEIRQSDAEAAKRALPIQYQSLPDNVLMPVLIPQLIERRIGALAAEKAGLDKDAKVKHDIEMARENVLQTAYLQQEAAKTITDAAVRDAYQQQIGEFTPQTEIRARHILMQDEAGIRLAEQRIVDGEMFATVAREMSMDSSREHGGDLGYFTRDKMVKEFSDAAFTLEPGQMSKPFRSQFGWHLVKVEDRRQTQPPTFEQVQGAIRAQMSEGVMSDKMAELRQQAKVERLDSWTSPATAPQVPGAPVAEPETPSPAPEPQAAPSAAAPSQPPAKAMAPSSAPRETATPTPVLEGGVAPPPEKLPVPAPSGIPQPPSTPAP